MVKNGRQAIALHRHLARGSKLWSQRGRAQLTALDLPRHTAQRREDSLELLTWLETHLDGLGSALLRWVLGHAAPLPARADEDLHRLSRTLIHRRGRPQARVAVARKRLVRLFIMVRDQIDNAAFRRRGRIPPPRRDLHPSPTELELVAREDSGPRATVPVRAFSE